MILGLFTGLTVAGGIERISQHTASVLAEYAHARGLPYRFLSLNDPTGEHHLRVDTTAFTVQGFARRKRAFIQSALACFVRSRFAYLAHPNLAPLGLALQVIRPSARYWVATYGIEVWQNLPLLARLGLQFATGVTALSRFTAQMLTTIQKIDSRKIVLAPPALDPEFLSNGRDGGSGHRLSFEGKILLTVARLASSERYKGIDTVIQALPMVRGKVPDVYYIVVGDGDDRPRLERSCREIGVSDRVAFVGAKFGEELASYYQVCHAFVMPSRGEGFGVVFLEAMAFGKPVIGGNHGGTPDVVVDGVTGFLVEYGDVDTLADRMITLLTDDDLRRRMGQAGRRRVLENYTLEHFRKRLLTLLEREG